MKIADNKGHLRRNDEIDSKYIMLLENCGKVIREPVVVPREVFVIPEGLNLFELDLRKEASVSLCGLFQEDLARFNPYNMLKVVDSVVYMAKEKSGALEPHEKEQFKYRKEVCKPCLDNGSCLVCGCKTPARFYSRAKCAGGKYPQLLNEEDWKKYIES